MDGDPPSTTKDKDVVIEDVTRATVKGLSLLAWVGIAIAIAVFIFLVALLFYKKRTSAKNANYDKGFEIEEVAGTSSDEAPPPTPPPTTTPPAVGTSFDEEHIGEIRATPTSMARNGGFEEGMEDYSTPD